MNRSRRGAKLLVVTVLTKAFFTFLPIGLADNQPGTFVVTQDQAPLTFYQDGKLTGVESLAKGTSINAESISADMVLTTYKGKAAYIQLKFLTARESVLVVATDNSEIFYYNDAGPTGLERLPRGTQIIVEKRSLEQVFTTYRGKPAYIKSQSLITLQEFTRAVDKEAATAREKVEKVLADAREKTEKVLAEKMDRDIKQLRTRVLNPKNSSAVGYYDQIINNEFRQFLANYPSSLYEAEVNDQMKEWQAERDRVASGLVKYDGEWVTKAHFDKYYRWDQVFALYREGDRFVSQTNWSAAVQKFDAVLALNPGGGTEFATKRQLVLSLTKWLVVLTRDLQISSDRTGNARNAFQQAQDAFKKAQANLKKPAQVSRPSFAGVHAGTSAAAMRTYDPFNSSQVELDSAKTKLEIAQSELDSAKSYNDKIKNTIDQARKRLDRDDLKVVRPEKAAGEKAPAA